MRSISSFVANCPCFCLSSASSFLISIIALSSFEASNPFVLAFSCAILFVTSSSCCATSVRLASSCTPLASKALYTPVKADSPVTFDTAATSISASVTPAVIAALAYCSAVTSVMFSGVLIFTFTPVPLSVF